MKNLNKILIILLSLCLNQVNCAEVATKYVHGAPSNNAAVIDVFEQVVQMQMASNEYDMHELNQIVIRIKVIQEGIETSDPKSDLFKKIIYLRAKLYYIINSIGNEDHATIKESVAKLLADTEFETLKKRFRILEDSGKSSTCVIL